MCEAFKQEKELGRQEGRREGRQEGAIEAKKEIVRNLYSNHMDIDMIMKVTSLTEEEIKKIIIC